MGGASLFPKISILGENMNNIDTIKIKLSDLNLLEDNIQKISLTKFVEENKETIRNELTKTLKTNFDGLDNPKKYHQIMKILKSFNRTPFPRQARLIASAVEYFNKEKNLIISAEMGSGKTLMALCSVLTYLYTKRKVGNIAIMCPSHLTTKWEEEINLLFKGIFNNIEIIQVKKGEDILKYKGIHNHNKVRFFIFSKETAKLNYSLTESQASILKRTIFDELKEPISAICDFCGTKYDYQERSSVMQKEFHKLVRKKTLGKKFSPIDEIRASYLTCKKCQIQTNAILSNELIMLKDKMRKKGFISNNQLFIPSNGLKFRGQNNKSAKARKMSIALAVKQLPKGFFEFLVADEIHELKGDTGQGQAFARIATHSKHTIGLTGTILNGYASSLYLILYRLFPSLMKNELELDFHKGQKTFIENFGGFKKTFRTAEDAEKYKNGVNTKKTSIENLSEYAVINPKIIRILLKHILFLRLDEMNVPLPDYREEVILVSPDSEVQPSYQSYVYELLNEIQINRNPKALGAFCSHSISILDNPSKPVSFTPDSGHQISYQPQVGDNFVTRKDRKLIDLVLKEQKLGRKILVYVTFVNGTLEKLKRILSEELLQKHELDLKINILDSKIDVSKRQQWIKNNPCDVLITNAELVKTGLDLLEYPTIIFYQTGFVTSTLEQASRRSWRLGQKNECRVFFLAYGGSAQFSAIKLMSNKIREANNIRGRLIVTSNELASMTDKGSSIQKAIVESVIAGNDDGDSDDIGNKWVFKPRELDPFEKEFEKTQNILLDKDFGDTIKKVVKTGNLFENICQNKTDKPKEISQVVKVEEEKETYKIKLIPIKGQKQYQLCFDF